MSRSFFPIKLAIAGVIGALLWLSPRASVHHYSQDDWSRKDAWKACAPMIELAGEVQVPECPALHLCANEAPLDAQGMAKLEELMVERGCEAP